MDRMKAGERCLCRMCPSYVKCEEEIAFCLSAGGRSACITEEKGCLCPGCPVLDEMGFLHVYYCVRGSENDQHRTG